ncbi:Histone-lysine N-methyltransferase SETMAR [Oopsacas minuta]|uniref:Histone-lysine N-methyltransferase SETMAR n=1 Tax=Oopsacas minuta TaxID=111878 RepID=A0AAV7JZN8_9METZ|nr:Histone-lysine N-methyltransferase SETMAR [Oopsacas minuta]
MAAIDDLGFECFPHPPHSPDLVPSAYWLFGEMKKNLEGRDLGFQTAKVGNKHTLNVHPKTQTNAIYRDEWVLQEDNSPVHTRKAEKAWKMDFTAELIDWPPNSPDLAPIVNGWAVLKKEELLKCSINTGVN